MTMGLESTFTNPLGNVTEIGPPTSSFAVRSWKNTFTEARASVGDPPSRKRRTAEYAFSPGRIVAAARAGDSIGGGWTSASAAKRTIG
ncbi:hypothetical protein AB0D46_26270 [Streptomyces sp. NPDC048383]|uniref:hypothetical protein n=1 Tax=Streptomyces sp. NPDC048383 TaxID=3155386 RepID=UPI0034202C80